VIVRSRYISDLGVNGVEPVIFVKAQRRSAADVMDDMFAHLFDKQVEHKGYVKADGTYVAPHGQRHKVKADPQKPKDPRGLDLAETYAADPALATRARRIATALYDEVGRPRNISRGDFKREFLEGKHADLVAADIDAEDAKAVTAKARVEKAKQDAGDLSAPNGYTLRTTNTEIHLSGPFDDDLHARIKRAGGRWDGVYGGNTKSWIVPIEKGSALKRIFAKWSPDEAAMQARAVKKRADEIERWLGYVESKAKEGWLYQNGMDKLRELGVTDEPEYAVRMEAAKARVQSVKADKEKRKAELWAEQDKQDKRGRESGRGVSAKPKPKPKPMPEGHIRVSVGQGYGGRPFVVGSTIRGPQDTWMTVVSAGKQYFREDGMSFGVGADEGYIFDATLRPATAEEIAPKERERKDSEDRATIRTKVKTIAEKVVSEGERPVGVTVPEGRTILDDQNAYGGGSWWVIGPDWIWYVRNNGMDGDDWSRNNVRTGGAGAIGWRVPYDATIDATLRLADGMMAKVILFFPGGCLCRV